MNETLRVLYSHYKIKNMGAILGASLAAAVPFVLALVLPVLLSRDLTAGLGALLAGLLATGQVLAVSGRLLERRFLGQGASPRAFLRAWAAGWTEGLLIGAILLGMFSLAFSSVPFYWSQGTAFGWFSLVMLAAGTVLILGALPFYLPVRRREGLGLLAAAGRSFRLMNTHPSLALGGLALGLLSVGASLATFGLFPGFGGLAALHQGMYDRVVSSGRQGTRGKVGGGEGTS